LSNSPEDGFGAAVGRAMGIAEACGRGADSVADGIVAIVGVAVEVEVEGEAAVEAAVEGEGEGVGAVVAALEGEVVLDAPAEVVGEVSLMAPNTTIAAMAINATTIGARERERARDSDPVSPHALAVRVGPSGWRSSRGALDFNVGATPAATRVTRDAVACPASPANGAIAATNAATVGHRFSGSFSRHDRIAAASSGGASGRVVASGGGSSRMIFAETSAFDAPSYGGEPVKSA
jgi:hypothetical protein